MKHWLTAAAVIFGLYVPAQAALNCKWSSEIRVRRGAALSPNFTSSNVTTRIAPSIITTSCAQPICIGTMVCEDELGVSPSAPAVCKVAAVRDSAGKWKCPSATVCANDSDVNFNDIVFLPTLSEIAAGVKPGSTRSAPGAQ